MCNIALFSYVPIRNIVPHIFEHVLSCRRTTQTLLNVTFPIPVIFLLFQQKYVVQKSFCILQ